MKNDVKMLKKAKELAKLLGLDIIEISNFWRNGIYCKVLPSLGIEEFLGYFSSAQFIITNGFHGMCFSIVFKKDFYVFSRDGVDLKLKSLASTLGIEEIMLDMDKELTPITINYEKVYERLNEERKKSMEFINMAIVNS
jgi:hypothetical protein